NYVHAGDQTESDGKCNAMGISKGVWHFLQELETFHEVSHHGLADPAQGQADYGDPQLHTVYNFIKVAVQSLDNASAGTPRFDELLNAGLAHADQREFRGRKEGVGRNQEYDQQDPEQHESDHVPLILTFQRCWRFPPLGSGKLQWEGHGICFKV